MVRLREQLWDFVEEVPQLSRWVKTHEPVGHWLQAAATSRAEGSCVHPEAWTGEEEFQGRWPILHAVGWLVPTTHEMDFQHRHDGRPVTLEGAYDLGYRGVIPTTIAEKITRPPTPGEHLENEDQPDKLVWDVASAIGAVGVSLSTMYAISLDKKMPLVKREEGQNEEGQPQGPKDATPGPPARNCEGRWCREKEQLGGGPPNPLAGREREEGTSAKRARCALQKAKTSQGWKGRLGCGQTLKGD
jgi:hypothetical protein